VVYSASAGTLTIFITDVVTPTARDLATTERLYLSVAFQAEGNYS
jgi:hypothetical protein